MVYTRARSDVGKKPSNATESDLTDDDMIIRYEDDEIVGLTIPPVLQPSSEFGRPRW
jgi:hypothetical protein